VVPNEGAPIFFSPPALHLPSVGERLSPSSGAVALVRILARKQPKSCQYNYSDSYQRTAGRPILVGSKASLLRTLNPGWVDLTDPRRYCCSHNTFPFPFQRLVLQKFISLALSSLQSSGLCLYLCPYRRSGTSVGYSISLRNSSYRRQRRGRRSSFCILMAH
jgi:hypothetical protein